MLGIGLGGFVSGLEAGARVGLGLRAGMKNRQNERARNQIAADAKAKYGDVLSDDAYDYMMKRQQALYVQNGEIDKALALRKWSEDETSRKGTKLFGSIGAALSAGDYKTTADLSNKLSDLKGYGPTGDYHFEYTQHPKAGEGFLVTTPDGKKSFVKAQDALPFFAHHFNPTAAAEWETQNRKSKADLEKEAQKIRSDAVKALEKQMDGGLSGDEPKFSDLPADERERLINKYAWNIIAPRRRQKFEPYFGAAGEAGGTMDNQSAPGIIVDNSTGKQVSPGSARAEAPAETEQKPGADGSIVRKDLPGLGAAAPNSPEPGPGSTTRAPQRENPLADNIALTDAVRAAEDEMKKTGNVARAKATLETAGVPENVWPWSVRRALRSAPEPAGISSGPSSRPNNGRGPGVPAPRQKPI